MHILLTGASGRVALAIRRVGSAEHRFVCVDSSPKIDGVGQRFSITDGDALKRAAEGCDAIIHTAAIHREHQSAGVSEREFLEINLLGAQRVYEAAEANGIRRVVVASTADILLGPSFTYGTASIDESLPPRPTTIYPMSKLLAEHLGAYHSRTHGLEVIQLRYGGIAFTTIDRVGLSLVSLTCTVADVAHATLLAATAPGLRCDTLLIGPDTPLTQHDANRAQRDPQSVLEHHWPGSVELMRRIGHRIDPYRMSPIIQSDRARVVLRWKPESNFAHFLMCHGWRPQAMSA